MKRKLFVFVIGLVVALLSISVIAIMVYPDYFTTQNEESGSGLPEDTSPSKSSGSVASSDLSVEASSEDTSHPESSGPVESSDPPEEAILPDDSSSATAEWGSGEVYDGSAPIIRKMGEELRVNALPHRKQNEKPPMSTEVFAFWEGELAFTVTDAELFDSIEETGLNYDDFVDKFEGYEDTYKPLVIKMTVKNISARSTVNPRSTEDEPDPYIFYSGEVNISCKEEFSPEKFRTHSDDEWPIGMVMPLVYVDQHMDGPYDYYFYTLKEGEAVDLTMCFYADTAAAPLDELYLEIITSSDDHRFGIALDQLKGMD